MATLREVSKLTYSASPGPTHEDIRTGAVQRIADALEVMSGNYQRLIKDRDFYKRRSEELYENAARLTRSNIALRGVITRLKKKNADR